MLEDGDWIVAEGGRNPVSRLEVILTTGADSLSVADTTGRNPVSRLEVILTLVENPRLVISPPGVAIQYLAWK